MSTTADTISPSFLPRPKTTSPILSAPSTFTLMATTTSTSGRISTPNPPRSSFSAATVAAGLKIDLQIAKVELELAQTEVQEAKLVQEMDARKFRRKREEIERVIRAEQAKIDKLKK